MNDKDIRSLMKLKRLSLEKKDVLSLSESVKNNLFSLDFFAEKSTFFIYNSINNEVDTSSIISTLLSLNKTIAYPITIGDIMIAGIPKNNEFTVGKFSVKEPITYTELNKIDVCLVPLVACDKNKNRIGYGKGYYDKFLSKTPCVKIGLCYDFQVLDKIQPKPFDVPLDYIVTPTKIYN